MGEIKIKDKEIVTPGEILASGMDFIPLDGAFREGDKVIASQVGLAIINNRLIKVIPFSGGFNPKNGDTVIGYVKDFSFVNWFIDVGYAYDGVLSIKDASSDYIERGADLSNYFDVGDIVLAKITKVDTAMNIDLTMKGPGLRKLTFGNVIEISAQKIPRVVGKHGSMISLIKEKTGCQIIASQNGRIWINHKDPANLLLATKAIKLIGEQSHMSGLTEKVNTFLTKGERK
ncbi:MAG: exosome complex RNA-binding protein Rrp4 [Nanoarchaeota archaeon]|nr:exosome complex RNA-binding protein Rrp4 [Nanoarchaeota archaeon]